MLFFKSIVYHWHQHKNNDNNNNNNKIYLFSIYGKGSKNHLGVWKYSPSMHTQ